MTVGILGLGLIGGSLARAYAKAGHRVLADEKDASILDFSMLSGAVHGVLNLEEIGHCDCILLAIYPAGSAAWLEEYAPYIRKDALVMDCCGTKREICRCCFAIAQKYGFTFIGGHPMAGTHHSGFKYSRSNLFSGAPMVLVPPRFDDIALLQRAKDTLSPCHFGSYCVTTSEEHDRMIAFTSQMPHILSNAYIKSPSATAHKGFSAGSYKDLTRVAWLNAPMWAELILDNRDNTLFELDTYIDALLAYREAIESQDRERLTELLEEGKRRKEEVDG